MLDRCDVLDLLEDSMRLKRELIVELKDGGRFVDEARDVVTDDDREEWALFRSHEQVPVRHISFCAPAVAPEPSYRGKPERRRPPPE
jgi:hypothetical protein